MGSLHFNKIKLQTGLLLKPVDGASLGFFRIAFGTIFAFYSIWLFASGFIDRNYLHAKFFFRFCDFTPLSSVAWLPAVFVLIGVSAACIALGYFYRIAAVLFFLSFTFFVLLDQTRFQNHYYLTSLLAFLLCFMPADRCFSIGRGRSASTRAETVPNWCLFLLKAQISIVYFFGAYAKVNLDWLTGSCITAMLEGRRTLFFNQPLTDPHIVFVIVVGGLVVDFILSFLPWIGKTRLMAFAVALLFHVGNFILFGAIIDVFPFLMIAAFTLFFAPSWPRRFLKSKATNDKDASAEVSAGPDLAVSSEVATGAEGAVSPEAASNPEVIASAEFTVTAGVPENAEAAESAEAAVSAEAGGKAEALASATCVPVEETKKSLAGPVFCLVYLALQIIIPFRQYAVAHDQQCWTKVGRDFAWRMMLCKHVCGGVFFMQDPRTGGVRMFSPRQWLTSTQLSGMLTNPYLIVQFANHVADQVKGATGVRPIIKACVISSLNRRPFQYLLDPDVNLAQPFEQMPECWIVPMDAPAKPTWPTFNVTLSPDKQSIANIEMNLTNAPQLVPH